MTLALQLFWLPIFSCVLWLSCALHRGHAPEGDAASWQGSPCKKLCHTILIFCLPNCELKIALFFINSACTKYFVITTNNWHLPEVVWLTTSRISACTQICQTPKHLPITTCSTCQAGSSVWQRELLQPCLLVSHAAGVPGTSWVFYPLSVMVLFWPAIFHDKMSTLQWENKHKNDLHLGRWNYISKMKLGEHCFRISWSNTYKTGESRKTLLK